MSNTHDFKRGDLVYINGLPAVVYYVSPLQIRVFMLKRGDLKVYRINRDRPMTDAVALPLTISQVLTYI